MIFCDLLILYFCVFFLFRMIITIHIYFMLKHIQSPFCRYTFAIEKRLFVHDRGITQNINEHSGIRATIFGATGFIGLSIASRLGWLGSAMVMPVASGNQKHYQNVKELKVTGTTHKSWLQYDADFRDEKLINDLVKNSNVVINLLGPRKKLKKREDFEFINIQVAEKIAKACERNGVLRLIHMSSAAADPNSNSLDFQTKYEAEAVVKKAFPNVTILRPCLIYGIGDYSASLMQRQSTFFFNKFVPVYDDLTTLKQPVREHDVTLAIMNALKLHETRGKTYELGGPHQLTTLQMHEIVFNMLRVQPKLAYVNPDIAMSIAKYIYNWKFFGQEVIRKRTIPEVVTGQYGTIQDLCVEPVAFKNGIFEIMREYIVQFAEKDVDNEG